MKFAADYNEATIAVVAQHRTIISFYPADFNGFLFKSASSSIRIMPILFGQIESKHKDKRSD
ncbi:MAG: hypothetical protein HFH94_09455 [Lachnospiraceae bacterium]|jgi:hypothetical protein|nr:hypothetical protein [Lachnospiraceae bacterium]